MVKWLLLQLKQFKNVQDQFDGAKIPWHEEY